MFPRIIVLYILALPIHYSYSFALIISGGIQEISVLSFTTKNQIERYFLPVKK